LAGGLAAIVAGFVLWGLLSVRHLVSPTETGITLQYFAMLSALWLAAGLAAAAGRVGWVSIAFAVGAGTAVTLRVAANESLVAAQRAGILAAVLVSLVAARQAWHRGSTRSRTAGAGSGRHRDDGPAAGERIRETAPVVVFGAAFAALVLVGQVATW